MSAAGNLAQDKLEEVERLSYADAALSAGTHQDTNNPVGESGQSGGIYSRSWIVAVDSPISGTKTISVTVTWPPAGSTTHTVTLVTIKGQ